MAGGSIFSLNAKVNNTKTKILRPKWEQVGCHQWIIVHSIPFTTLLILPAGDASAGSASASGAAGESGAAAGSAGSAASGGGGGSGGGSAAASSDTAAGNYSSVVKCLYFIHKGWNLALKLTR